MPGPPTPRRGGGAGAAAAPLGRALRGDAAAQRAMLEELSAAAALLPRDAALGLAGLPEVHWARVEPMGAAAYACEGAWEGGGGGVGSEGGGGGVGCEGGGARGGPRGVPPSKADGREGVFFFDRAGNRSEASPSAVLGCVGEEIAVALCVSNPLRAPLRLSVEDLHWDAPPGQPPAGLAALGAGLTLPPKAANRVLRVACRCAAIGRARLTAVSLRVHGALALVPIAADGLGPSAPPALPGRAAYAPAERAVSLGPPPGQPRRARRARRPVGGGLGREARVLAPLPRMRLHGGDGGLPRQLRLLSGECAGLRVRVEPAAGGTPPGALRHRAGGRRRRRGGRRRSAWRPLWGGVEGGGGGWVPLTFEERRPSLPPHATEAAVAQAARSDARPAWVDAWVRPVPPPPLPGAMAEEGEASSAQDPAVRVELRLCAREPSLSELRLLLRYKASAGAAHFRVLSAAVGLSVAPAIALAPGGAAAAPCGLGSGLPREAVRAAIGAAEGAPTPGAVAAGLSARCQRPLGGEGGWGALPGGLSGRSLDSSMLGLWTDDEDDEDDDLLGDGLYSPSLFDRGTHPHPHADRGTHPHPHPTPNPPPASAPTRRGSACCSACATPPRRPSRCCRRTASRIWSQSAAARMRPSPPRGGRGGGARAGPRRGDAARARAARRGAAGGRGS